MLGLAQAAHLSPEFLPDARRVADWYLSHVPADMVCYWDFDDPAIPDAPRDTSATAIAAAALAQLDGENYAAAATSTVAALAGGHIGTHGGLIDGCYHHNKGLAVSDELIWGDYFLMEATLTLAGVLDPARPG